MLFERSRMGPAKMGIDPVIPPDLAGARPEPFIKSPRVLPALPELPVFVVLPALPTTPVVAIATMEGLHRRQLFDQLMGRGAVRQRMLLDRRVRDSDLYWQRGLLFLLEGNIGEAKKRFIESRQSGVPEWGVPDQRSAEAEALSSPDRRGRETTELTPDEEFMMHSTWTIAGVQMDCVLGDKSANLETMARHLAAAAGRGAKLIVFPECVLTGYGFESRDEVRRVAESLPGPSTERLARMRDGSASG